MKKRAVSLVVLILLLSSLAVFFAANLAESAGPKDETPPTGSIVINNGDQYTTSNFVTLTLTAYDPESGIKQVRYSNNGVWNNPWEKFTETKSWTLTTGDGVKTVCYQIRNNDNVISITYSDTIILNTTEPTPTPEPTVISSPTPSPEPSGSTSSSTGVPQSTPQPENKISPTPSPKSGFDPILTDKSQNEEGKVIAVSLVIVFGCSLLFLINWKK